jgi:periplasmic divalent cation tolerance protein
MIDIWMLYSTFGNSDEAIFVARDLLKSRLIACANVMDGVTSIYHWEGTVQQEKEVTLVAKTSAGRVEKAISRIKELHSYQVPSVAAWPLERGYAPFMEWVAGETSE